MAQYRSYDGDPRIEHTGASVTYIPTKPSSFVKIQVGEDWLPTDLKLSNGWKDAFGVSQYSESIMTAYQYSVFERSVHIIEAGGQGSRTIPSLREIFPTLLRTRTYSECMHTLEQAMGGATYTAHGQGWNEFDEPAITVEANSSGLIGISIDPDWSISADSFTIAYDILDCCRQIRAMRPAMSADPQLDRHSDDELAERFVSHVKILFRDEYL
ncbi:hypothetical protein [Nocardia sp. NPDC003726]